MNVASFTKAGLWLLITGFLFKASSQAQQTPFYKQIQIVPNSPEASALYKVTDIPVDPSSGTANVDIPLYTIEDGNIRIPISISYNTGGIKVQDVAGLTGLGWNINSGGIISVRQEIYEPGANVANAHFKSVADIQNEKTDDAVAFCSMVIEGKREKAMPEYTYRFGEYSGSFFYDIHNQLYIKSYNKNLNILPITNGFRIITDKGIVYTFSNQELYTGQNGWSATSAYYITSISDPNTNRTVTFKYKSSSYGTTHETQSLMYIVPVITGCCAQSIQNAASATFSVQTTQVMQVDSIIFSSGYIKFQAANDRVDLLPTRITGMSVYNNQNLLVKNVKLYQSYFVSSTGLSTAYKNRMKLDSLVFTDAVSNNIERYGFFYINKWSPCYKRTDSHDQTGVDFWGYYNGQEGNGGLIPIEMIDPAELTPYATATTNMLGYRKADSNYAREFSLEKIIYPTGAVLQFDYESNVVQGHYLGSVVGGLRIRYLNYYDHWNDLFPVKRKYFNYIKSVLPMPGSTNDFGYATYKRPICQEIACSLGTGCEHVARNVYTKNYYSDPIGMNGRYMVRPFYSQVEEFDMKGNVALQKKIYHYDTADQFFRVPWPAVDYGNLYFAERTWIKDGLLKRTDIFRTDSSNNFRLVQKEVNTYTDYEQSSPQIGVLVAPKAGFDYMGGNLRSEHGCASAADVINAYEFLNTVNTVGMRRLTHKDVIEYSLTDSMVTATDYVYNAYYYLQSQVVTNSKGDNITTSNKYPFDKSYLSLTPTASAAVDSMMGRHMLDYALTRSEFKGPDLLRTDKINYKVWSEPSGAIIQPETIEEQVLTNPYDIRYQIFSYSNNGNIQERGKPGDTKEAFVWGYNGVLPVASIQGSDFATVNPMVNQSIVQNPSSDAQMITALNNIRTGLASQKALVSTYTHTPLVGVTSMTDPSGKTTSYSYDAFNRLSYIKDMSGSIIKTFDYSYTGRPGYAVTYYNRAVSSLYNRTNCLATEIPGSWLYTVPEGKYTSTVSQAAADQLAQNDIVTNGQNTANANASCAAPVMVNFTYRNASSSLYVIRLTTSANQSYVLSLPPTTGDQPVTAGQVPTGVYSAYLFSPQGGSPRNMILGNVIQTAVYSVSVPVTIRSAVDASACIYN